MKATTFVTGYERMWRSSRLLKVCERTNVAGEKIAPQSDELGSAETIDAASASPVPNSSRSLSLVAGQSCQSGNPASVGGVSSVSRRGETKIEQWSVVPVIPLGSAVQMTVCFSIPFSYVAANAAA